MNNVFGSGRPAAFLKNPTRGYQPSPWSPITVMGGAAVWGDQPFFTWGDVLLMGRDPVIRYGLKLLRSPFSRVEFNVTAQRPAVKRFVSVTLRRFWRRDLPRLLHNYFKWGRSAGGAEYKYNRRLRLMQLTRVREVKPYDADPQLYAPGSANAGQFAGYRLRTGMSGDMTMVGSPNCFFFAGYEELSPCCDVPRLAGAFVPYLEKNSPGGLRASRRLFYWTRAVGSTVVRYPDGSTKLRDGTTVNNEDIARQTGENRQNGTVIAIPNIRHAAIDGKFAWEIEDSPASGDVAGIRDAVRDLDEEELLGLEIPPEIVRAADVGSGWSGRSIPMETWLGGADELTGMLLDTFRQQILDPLVRLNFRTDVYEVENISLLEQFRKENAGGKDDQNPPDGKPPGPGQGGSPPDILPGGNGASLSELPARVVDAVKKSKKAMRRTADVRRAAAIAMMFSREQWLNRGKPEEGQAELDRLAELANDPDRLEQVATGSADLSWVTHGESRSGKPRWKDTETGKLRYQKSMPGTRTAAREKSVASAKRAYELSKLVNNGTATSSHLRELADHIPALTVGKLRTYRQILMARFNNARTRDGMVKALLNHVRQEQAGKEAEEGTPKEEAKKLPEAAGKVEAATAKAEPADGSNVKPIELTRFEINQLLANPGDRYKDVNHQRNELKGQRKDSGDPIYGYPHAPEHFVKSDATGRPIRHYIKLPNGQTVHPDELRDAINRGRVKVKPNPIDETKAAATRRWKDTTRKEHLFTREGLTALAISAGVPAAEREQVLRERDDEIKRRLAAGDYVPENVKAEFTPKGEPAAKDNPVDNTPEIGNSTPAQTPKAEDSTMTATETPFQAQYREKQERVRQWKERSDKLPQDGPVTPEHLPPAELPADPIDITLDNVKAVWETQKAEIEKTNRKMSPAQAGSLAAARILNAVGERANEFINDIDKRVKAGKQITDEEDEKYIRAGDARKNLHGVLANLSGYRPHQEADEHPEAIKPLVGLGKSSR